MARHPVFQDTSFDVRLDRLLSRKRELARTMLVPPLSDGDGDAEELFKDTVGATNSDVQSETQPGPGQRRSDRRNRGNTP
jgi:hypothetical protein